MKKLILAASFALLSTSSAWAIETATKTLIVSVNQIVCPTGIELHLCEPFIDQAVEALNVPAPNHTGLCWAKAQVNEYIPYEPSEINYFGVALVELTYSCDQSGNDYIELISATPNYTVWGNPRIGPFPGISGSN